MEWLRFVDLEGVVCLDYCDGVVVWQCQQQCVGVSLVGDVYCGVEFIVVEFDGG